MNTITSLTPSHSLQTSCSTSLVLATAQKLHLEFVRLGGMRHKLKNRMLLILPQIYESGIYKKYAVSIVEYAGKYGDIAKTTVIKRLRLEENLQDKPCLKAAIGKVGVHKVAMVAKIATPEMDKAMAENLLNMSKMAVQSLSKEIRAGKGEDNVNKDWQLRFGGGDSIGQDQTLPCKAVSVTKKIELDEESTFFFMKLKAKLGKNLTDKEFLKLILEERSKQEFPQKQSGIINQSDSPKNRATNKISGKVPGKVLDQKSGATNKISDLKSVTGDTYEHRRALMPTGQVCLQKNITGQRPRLDGGDTFTETRYIRADKKRQITAKTNGKCIYPNCNSPFQILHHADRYSQSKNHNSVIPLCKIHHEFTHNNLIQNETQTPDKWQISIIKPSNFKISPADVLYKKYRREAFG